MDFANFEEFWKALTRLYDSTLENTEDIGQLREAAKHDRESAKQDREAARELREAAVLLASAVQEDHEVIMAPEHRLDRTEITIDTILEDLRRHREGRASQ
jgi:hypothetical protein